VFDAVSLKTVRDRLRRSLDKDKSNNKSTVRQKKEAV
jgi:hypothetical protein